MKDSWLAATSKAFPDGHAPGFPGYPLLGAEIMAVEEPSPGPWALRLSLCESVEAALLEAMLQDVQEVRLSGPAVEHWDQVGTRPLYLEGAEKPGHWTLSSAEDGVQDMALPGRLVTWTNQQATVLEQTITPDSKILKNLSALRTLPGRHGQVNRWVVGSAVSASGETEGLIADTLAYWSGAVAGIGVLEVAQQPGEGFDTLWARLGICRLLRWEADLGEPGDVLAGAGLFEQLSIL